jgi:alpha,alpha-trehalase
VIRDYDQWNQSPHLAGDTGLSRYFDHGDGPVPEIQGDPSHYYRGVAQFFLIHDGEYYNYLAPVDGSHPALAGQTFPTYVCDSLNTPIRPADCSSAGLVALTADFYKGDRSMRESGFDVTFRFGPFGADTHHFAPMCLNSLLYKTEKDLEEISTRLGRPDDAAAWRRKAINRQKLIDRLLWNEHQGLYFDYDFTKRAQSSYEYATTFYPLWAGLASKEQARRVAQNISLFEQLGGLAMSRHESEAQWDYPYGWAPVELLAVEGLRRYGYRAEADRISLKFLATVLRNFRFDHTIREKYDVVRESERTHIDFGYRENFTGFGWTNGVFLELLHDLPPDLLLRLKAE